jgi:hypothetical protein
VSIGQLPWQPSGYFGASLCLRKLQVLRDRPRRANARHSTPSLGHGLYRGSWHRWSLTTGETTLCNYHLQAHRTFSSPPFPGRVLLDRPAISPRSSPALFYGSRQVQVFAPPTAASSLSLRSAFASVDRRINSSHTCQLESNTRCSFTAFSPSLTPYIGSFKSFAITSITRPSDSSLTAPSSSLAPYIGSFEFFAITYAAHTPGTSPQALTMNSIEGHGKATLLKRHHNVMHGCHLPRITDPTMARISAQMLAPCSVHRRLFYWHGSHESTQEQEQEQERGSLKSHQFKSGKPVPPSA